MVTTPAMDIPNESAMVATPKLNSLNSGLIWNDKSKVFEFWFLLYIYISFDSNKNTLFKIQVSI